MILFDTFGSADSRLHSVFLYHLEVSRFVPIPSMFLGADATIFSTTSKLKDQVAYPMNSGNLRFEPHLMSSNLR